MTTYVRNRRRNLTLASLGTAAGAAAVGVTGAGVSMGLGGVGA